MTQPILALKTGSHWQMAHVEVVDDAVHLHNIGQYKSSPL